LHSSVSRAASAQRMGCNADALLPPLQARLEDLPVCPPRGGGEAQTPQGLHSSAVPSKDSGACCSHNHSAAAAAACQQRLQPARKQT
jgi:hypothetical protein